MSKSTFYNTVLKQVSNNKKFKVVRLSNIKAHKTQSDVALKLMNYGKVF